MKDLTSFLQPPDPLTLSAGALTRLLADYNDAGCPEDIFTFLATTHPWREMPVYVFRNTFEAMKASVR
jgi:hypothetical protein